MNIVKLETNKYLPLKEGRDKINTIVGSRILRPYLNHLVAELRYINKLALPYYDFTRFSPSFVLYFLPLS